MRQRCNLSYLYVYDIYLFCLTSFIHFLFKTRLNFHWYTGRNHMTDHVMRILNRYRDNDVKVNLFEITASDCFRINTSFPKRKAQNIAFWCPRNIIKNCQIPPGGLPLSFAGTKVQLWAEIYCIESNSWRMLSVGKINWT